MDAEIAKKTQSTQRLHIEKQEKTLCALRLLCVHLIRYISLVIAVVTGLGERADRRAVADTVLLIQPVSEIYQAAAFAAEGAPG